MADLKSLNLCKIDPNKIVLKNFVAEGAYGSVYRGLYNAQDVAIKILDWGEDDLSMETLTLRKDFQQEVSVWCSLDHPHISKFIGASLGIYELKSGNVDMTKKVCCVVTEFQPCGTLKSYLTKKREKKLDFKSVIRISLELAKGLSYLHSKKVVHRDIKTDNILLGKNKTVKISDFGVARTEALNQNEMTGYQTLKISDLGVSRQKALDQNKMTGLTGTIGYMAPEVFTGEPYTRKCDVYSFGICLWEIYYCDMPYKHITLDESTSAEIYKKLRPEIPRSCPKSLADVMQRCWDADPNKRPEMEEVVSMLEEIEQPHHHGCFLLEALTDLVRR